MSNLEQYKNENYPSNPLWFESEVKQPYHVTRISRVLRNQNYLKGLHDILTKPDVVHKGVEFNTSKMILQTVKTILNFHSTFVLGRPVNIVGTKDMADKYNGIYRKGKYHKTNYSIIDNMNKYGDVYEYIYYDNGTIKSRLIDSADGYPIYNGSMEYVGFIEYYTDSVSNMSSYTIYSDDVVEVWSNEGGVFGLLSENNNISGLPVHYKNSDEMFGMSVIDDIKPILDKIEVVVNRLDDAVYTLSMNPVGVLAGQSLSGSADAEGIGFVLNIEDGGEFKWAVAQLDYNSTKLLLDTLFNQLFMIAQVPSIVMGQSNVANVSEVSLKLLFSLAHNKGIENAIYLKDGFGTRNEQIEKIFKLNGVKFSVDDYVDIEFNFNRPSDDAELIDTLSTQFKDGAMSKQTYIEKSPNIGNGTQEIERLKLEGKYSLIENETI